MSVTKVLNVKEVKCKANYIFLVRKRIEQMNIHFQGDFLVIITALFTI